MLEETVEENYQRFTERDRAEVESFFEEVFLLHEELETGVESAMTFTSDYDEGDHYEVSMDDERLLGQLGMLQNLDKQTINFVIHKTETGYQINPRIFIGSEQVYKENFEKDYDTIEARQSVKFYDLQAFFNLAEQFMKQHFGTHHTTINNLTETTTKASNSWQTQQQDYEQRPLIVHYSIRECDACSFEEYSDTEICYPSVNVKKLREYDFLKIRNDLEEFFQQANIKQKGN